MSNTATKDTRVTLTLQDLADEALALDAIFAMDDGEFTPEAEQLANELLEKLVAKCDGYADYIGDMTSRALLIKEEEKRLAARRHHMEGVADWMRRNAVVAMQRMGRPKIQGERYTLALQNNPAAVEVDVLPDALPPEYVRTIPPVPEQRVPDKAALAVALKGGVVIEGVRLVITQHLRIR